MKKIIIISITVLLMSGIAFPGSAASENSNDIVRIGFYESSGMFAHSDGTGKKSGYCYEYMMQLASYTGWKYEFVYGSFSELYQMLSNGKIDILPYTNSNEQRQKEVLFSNNALAIEEYYIATKSASYNSIELLDKCSIATIDGADFNEMLLDFLEEHDLDAELKYYPVIEDVWDALRKGDAEAAIYTSLTYSKDGWNCICNFGEKPTYVAVSKDRPDLLETLDEACDLVEQEKPSFIGDLYEKYFPDNPMRNSLTVEEQSWIDTHPLLRIGGFANDAPYIFSFNDANKTASGLTVELVDGIIDRLHLKTSTEFICFNSLAKMEEALDAGEIDVIIPFYPDYYVAEQHNLIISNVARVSNMELVYKRGTTYDEAFRKISTPATKLGIYYVKDHYPDSDIVGAESIMDAVDKVLSGEATGAIAQNVELHNIKERYDNLDYIVLPDGCGTCFAARPHNYPLIRVLNRGLNYFSNAEISAIASKYSYSTLKSYTLTDFVKDNVLWIVTAILVIALIFVIMIRNNAKRVSEALEVAKDANEAKSRFLFNMSHDIRTPMNAIIGFTAMAKKYSGDKDSVNDYLDKIDMSGQQLLSLVNNVLEMARIESGNVELDEIPVNIQREFDALVSILSEQAKEKGLSFEYEMQNVKHYEVFADEARMSSITMNITGNAMKYTPEGGHIHFSLKEITGRKTGYATYAFSVADTGIGMSEEYQKSIFEPFSREKSTTVSKIQGTGLGLSIVKNLVDLMGGTIEVQSEPGKGTRFDITIDFRINESVASAPIEEQETNIVSFEGRRVLLVEDNELNREIAKDILEEHGLIVENAEDGDIAVAMVQAVTDRGEFHYYDFILMDVQMPRMNGYEATKAIRALLGPDGVHIPIIAMTANAFEEDRQNALAAGMDEHLAKPIDVQKMFTTIAKFL